MVENQPIQNVAGMHSSNRNSSCFGKKWLVSKQTQKWFPIAVAFSVSSIGWFASELIQCVRGGRVPYHHFKSEHGRKWNILLTTSAASFAKTNVKIPKNLKLLESKIILYNKKFQVWNHFCLKLLSKVYRIQSSPEYLLTYLMKDKLELELSERCHSSVCLRARFFFWTICDFDILL